MGPTSRHLNATDHGGRDILLLNNYAGTGIGDFGDRVQTLLAERGVTVHVEETLLGWSQFFRQFRSIVGYRGVLVANLGLTSWGRSGPRNLLGFFGLRLRGLRGRRTILLLHNAIEVIEPEDTGYRVGPVARWGAHFAVRLARRAEFVVFSRSLAEALRRNYGIAPASAQVHPCEAPAGRPSPLTAQPVVVSLGYISPYKGTPTLLEVFRRLRPRIRLKLIGKPHRLLSGDPEFARPTALLLRTMETEGVELAGFVPDRELASVLSGCSIGLLAHTSTTGASGSFARLAGAGLPVVLPDLPEFRDLKAAGAGVVLARADPGSLAQALEGLLDEPARWAELVEQQRQFVDRFSWGRLGDWLVDTIRTGAASKPGSPTEAT